MTTVTTSPENAPGRAAGSRTSATPRTSRIGIWSALYALTLRQHLHGKRWLAVSLLFLIPAGLAVLIRATSPVVPSRLLDFLLAWMLIPQALLPLVALLYASGVVQDEQEEQTITYLLVRPISKWMMYSVKLIATATSTVLLVIALTVLTYAAIYAGSGIELNVVFHRCAWACAILSLAVVAYSSLFGLMGLLTKRVLVVGVLYTAIVEGLLASLPFSLRMATIIYYTRLIAYRTLDFVVTWPGDREDDVAAIAWMLDTAADPTLSEHPQLLTCVLVLLCSSLVCAIVAGWICSRREFHVKTPDRP
jgi:ABC-2 type transport system permease protein